MATEYTWSFPNFDVDSENKVKTIHWSYDAVDGEHSARMYGSCGVNEEKDFETITKAEVVSIVLGEQDQTEDELKANLDSQIANLKAPETVSKTKEF